MDLASLAQLDHSHRRHDSVMDDLLAAARRLAMGRPDPGDPDTVHRAVTYFQHAVKRHFLDEEGSVFPRLSTRRPDLAPQLATLSSEHPAQIALQHAIAEAALGLSGSSQQGAGKRLLEATERLAELHRGHVAREDRLFDTAREVLTAEDDAEIVAEMETRRHRDGEHGGGGRGGANRRSNRPTTNMRRPELAAKPAIAEKRTTAKTRTAAKKRPTAAKRSKPTKPKKRVAAAKPRTTRKTTSQKRRRPAATKNTTRRR